MTFELLFFLSVGSWQCSFELDIHCNPVSNDSGSLPCCLSFFLLLVFPFIFPPFLVYEIYNSQENFGVKNIHMLVWSQFGDGFSILTIIFMYASHWSSLTLFKISGFCCYALVLKIVEFVDLALIFFFYKQCFGSWGWGCYVALSCKRRAGRYWMMDLIM